MTREEATKWLIRPIVSSTGIGEFKAKELKAYELAIEALSEPKTGWIPVSERLPIPPTFCLVTTDGSHGDVIDIALYMSDGWHKASDVIAWMPLPEPYNCGAKMGGEEDG